MYLQRKSIALIFTVLFITIPLASCNQPIQINVACDSNDLIHAINTANSNSDTTKIVLDPNCTYPFITRDNTDGGHGGNALPIITTPILIDGNYAILKYDGIQQFRFFLISNTGGLRLDNLTLEGGYSIAVPDEILPGGGAIYITEGGSSTLNHVVFRDNYNLSNGGAILNRGTLIIDDDSVFENNSAELGGALFNAGGSDKTTSIYNTQFIGNNASDGGGAIYNLGPDSFVQIGSVEFKDNWTWFNGGAIYTDSGEMRIVNSLLQNNEAEHYSNPIGKGGAIYKADGEMFISGTTISSNSAILNGAGIYHAAGSLILNDCSIVSNIIYFHYDMANQAGYGDGGGIYNLGRLEIDSSTLRNNFAAVSSNPLSSEGGDGGGIYNGDLLIVTNSTFDDNYANRGGALCNTKTMTVLNGTFVMNNAKITGSGIFNDGSFSGINFSTFFLSLGYTSLGVIHQESGTFILKNSLISDNHSDNCHILGGTFTAMGDNYSNDTTCPGFTVTVPGTYLDTTGYADHGGPTKTVSITEFSAAYNHADCYTIAGDPVNRDQRGISRPQPSGSTCDIGAFELEIEGDDTSSADEQPTSAPTQEPTATSTSEPLVPMLFAPQNTTCRKGDSVEYEDAGYLLAGESAEVIGRNQAGTWLVIDNPDWDGICWILRAIVETEGDVDGTKVYIPAPLPTKTPVLGCLVQSPMVGGDPVCVVPCPDDAVPGDPCTP